MYCKNCAKKMSDEALTCPDCGQTINLKHGLIITNELKYAYRC